MYFCSVFNIISIFSVTVSAVSADSDFTLPYDDLGLEDTSLADEQTALSSNWWDPPSDQTPPLFDADLYSTDGLDGFDVPENVGTIGTNPSEIAWDDPLQLADCSMSSDVSNLSNLRVRRGDAASTRCSKSDGSESFSSKDGSNSLLMLPQVYDDEKHSDSCWFATLGLLPYAVIGSGSPNDLSVDRSRTYKLRNMRQYFPTTVSHATIRMTRKAHLNPGVMLM